jgi:hypothetical protein
MNMNDTSMISAMFEEVRHGIKAVENKINALENKTLKVDLPDLSAVESKFDELTAVLHEVENGIKQPSVQQHRHRHTIDVKSSWTVIFIVGLCIFSIALIFLAGRQWQIINRYSDSDLKYRYIKTANGIEADKLLKLETLFEYNRDNGAIRELRRQVENYERALKEQARKLEQARFKESEAERLRKEADELNVKTVK